MTTWSLGVAPHRLLRSVLPACATLALLGCDGRVTRQAMATVLQTNGLISVTAKGRSFAPDLGASDSRFLAGDRLQSGDSASIDFMALPGMFVHLDADSDLLIERLSVTKYGHAMRDAMKAREVRLRLTRGILVVVVSHADKRSRLVVFTPRLRLCARAGSTLRLQIDGQKTRAACVRGKINLEFTESGERARIEAGYFLEFPPVANIPRLVEESGQRAQSETAEALEIEAHLLFLKRREQAAIVPWRR